jgi:DNA invertase Pin-like site-specific DNA recombinase
MMSDLNTQNIHIKYLVVCDWNRVSRDRDVLMSFIHELNHLKIAVICINDSLTAIIENLKRPPLECKELSDAMKLFTKCMVRKL